jgi:phosphomannomutase
MVRFGHDGWVGELAYDLTFESVVRTALSAGVTIVRNHAAPAKLVVAHDRRFLGDEFARIITRELAKIGIEVVHITEPILVSMLSMTITTHRAVGGIMVSAGRAPATRNGLMLRGADGGALPRWMLDQISELSGSGMRLPRIGPAAEVHPESPIDQYLTLLEDRFALKSIRSSGITVAVDTLWGVTAGLLPEIIDGDGSRTIEMRTTHNPLFPELNWLTPDVSNIERLQKLVRTGDAAVGIALSADGSLGAILDERGILLQPGVIASLIAWHGFHVRRQTGAIARAISSSSGVDTIADQSGAPVHELPSGYTAACEAIRETSPLVAFDNEGGVMLPDLFLERDGIVMSLLVMLMMVDSQQELSDLVAEVQQITGPLVLLRSHLDLDAAQVDLIRARLERDSWPDHVAGLRVEERYETDGVRLLLEQHAWLLMRYDDIDGALELTAEARSPETANALIAAGRSMMLVED